MTIETVTIQNTGQCRSIPGGINTCALSSFWKVVMFP